MEDAAILRQRADEHRAAARITHDLWESVMRFNLAARYDELAAHRETRMVRMTKQRQRETQDG